MSSSDKSALTPTREHQHILISKCKFTKYGPNPFDSSRKPISGTELALGSLGVQAHFRVASSKPHTPEWLESPIRFKQAVVLGYPSTKLHYMAVGQNQGYHFGVGALPILVNFSGWIRMFTGG